LVFILGGDFGSVIDRGWRELVVISRQFPNSAVVIESDRATTGGNGQ